MAKLGFVYTHTTYHMGNSKLDLPFVNIHKGGDE